jgi:6-phosphogluconate dehydrogenase
MNDSTSTSNGCLGLVGLGVMGGNLARNAAEKSVRVVAYERDPDMRARFAKGELGGAVELVDDLEALVAALPRPRAILLMVTAGDAVDQVIADLRRHLDEGDAIADGGNSLWADTERRAKALLERDLHLLGMGVSGGAEGARRGPCMMPGGTRRAWEAFRPALEPMAARTPDGPCVAHMGPGGAGHFVKMVHNGIEYGQMQLLAEGYELARRVMGASNAATAELFAGWNAGALESFLVEISAKILTVADGDGSPLVEHVLDRAEQKGTGRWTVMSALEVGVPIPTIAAGLDARSLSSRFELRQRLAGRVKASSAEPVASDAAGFDGCELGGAVLLGFLASFAQGFDLLSAWSTERRWNLPFATIARIWQGGCIVRARLLETLKAGFERAGGPLHLFEDAVVSELIERHLGDLRRVVASAARHGSAAPALSASLSYIDALRTDRLPTSLVQAQRDAFGAHGFRRVEDPNGAPQHVDWLG